MTYQGAILGDNQFLGVNHSNQAKAAELYDRFSQPDAILDVLGAAYDAGVRDFMFTTHDRYDAVFDEIRRSRLFPEMQYTPCLPYAHKYWSKLSNQGAPALLASTVMKVNPLRIIPASLGMLLRRPGALVRLLTEIEVLMCKGLPVRGVFLQNAVVDLLLAIEAHRELEAFANAVTKRLNALPGFITMNHPKAVSVLCDDIGLEKPWLCANYNLAGFRMNPSTATVEQAFSSGRTHNIAMSVFSSRSEGAAASLAHVVDRMSGGGIDAILFGSANPDNIRANLKVIQAGPGS